VQVKLLQGNDGVEKWKDKKIWDCVLKNVQIVVSTPQVLLEALTHGFVRLATLSLLVFDEGNYTLFQVRVMPYLNIVLSLLSFH
jgi:ERCC4-related helicase